MKRFQTLVSSSTCAATVWRLAVVNLNIHAKTAATQAVVTAAAGAAAVAAATKSTGEVASALAAQNIVGTKQIILASISSRVNPTQHPSFLDLIASHDADARRRASCICP
jgi:hypothetical protein